MAADPERSSTSPRTSRAPVTVIVPTFNRAPFLRFALDSLLAQDWKPQSIVCIDDGSGDDTPAVVASYGDAVRYVRQDNAGKAVALNTALPLVDTEFVWFFDDDDHAYPWALSTLLGALQADPTLDFAFGTSDLGRSTTDGSVEFVRARDYPVLREPMETQRATLLRQSYFTLCGCIVRMAAIDRVGVFRCELTRSQDYEFLVRLASRGRFRYVERSVFLYRAHPGVRGSSQERIAAGRVQQTWRKYDQVIGDELVRRLELLEYARELPDLAGSDPSTRAVPPQRFARITRAWILATKSQIPIVVDDLVRALVDEPSQTALSRTESARLLALMNHHYFAGAIAGHLATLMRLRALKRSENGRAALRMLARGLYWQARSNGRAVETSLALLLAGLYALASMRVRLRPARWRQRLA